MLWDLTLTPGKNTQNFQKCSPRPIDFRKILKNPPKKLNQLFLLLFYIVHTKRRFSHIKLQLEVEVLYGRRTLKVIYNFFSFIWNFYLNANSFEAFFLLSRFLEYAGRDQVYLETDNHLKPGLNYSIRYQVYLETDNPLKPGSIYSVRYKVYVETNNPLKPGFNFSIRYRTSILGD